MCYCVTSAPAYTSAGPLSLKQNGAFTFVITSGYTDSHTAHSTHNTDEDEAKKTEEAFHNLERDEVQLVCVTRCKPERPSGPQRTRNGDGGTRPRQASLRLTTEANEKYNFLVTAMVTDTEGRKHNEGSCE